MNECEICGGTVEVHQIGHPDRICVECLYKRSVEFDNAIRAANSCFGDLVEVQRYKGEKKLYLYQGPVPHAEETHAFLRVDAPDGVPTVFSGALVTFIGVVSRVSEAEG